MPSSRHLGRVIVMQTLFAHEFEQRGKHGDFDPEATLEYISREFEGNSDRKLDDSTIAFAYELLNGVLRHEVEVRSLIVHYAPEWPVEKIAPVDRAVLEIGIFEILHSRDVPPVVAIDEAIELAKSFGSESAPKFVNGVLNAILESTKNTPKKDGTSGGTGATA